jgi:hypothetical protein
MSLVLWCRTQALADDAALQAIFAEHDGQSMTVLEDRHVRQLDPAQAYQFLTDWVLPSATRNTFRLNGWFRPTGQIPDKNTALAAFVATGSERPLFNRLVSSETEISPALSLVEAAADTGRLAELRQQILASEPASAQQKYNRAVLWFLVEHAQNDVPRAREAFDEIISLTPELDSSSRAFRWPAYLLLKQTFSHRQLQRLVSEFYFSVLADLAGYSSDAQLEVLNDHLRMLQTLEARLQDEGPDQPADFLPAFNDQWTAFSYVDAQTKASGRPRALWQVRQGIATKLIGHEYDFLCFRLPLRGDFEIECDFTSDYGRNVAFMFAGQHLQINRDGKSLIIGNARNSAIRSTLETPLTAPESWSRYRATLHNGVLTQFINGGPVMTRRLAPDHCPWFAIRTWRRADCSIRDLRITGNPQVPEEVQLICSPNLDSWAPYFEPNMGHWTGMQNESGEIQIQGRMRPELQGMVVEKLLRYFRPLMEQGTLSYEFFYQADAACVHPALDNQAYLFTPTAIGIHQITERSFDQQGLNPSNLEVVPHSQLHNQLHNGNLPLLENEWNRVTLALGEDDIRIQLNDVPVFAGPLDRNQTRSFGFFHYADRTEARIRNVVWKGNWPTRFPEPTQQSLADRSLDDLEARVARLPAVFSHDFRNGAPDDLFEFQHNDNSELIHEDDGVRIKRLAVGGDSDLFARIQLHGDFDIVATFDELDIKMPEPRWDAGLGLRMTFSNDLTHRCSLFRSTCRSAENRRVQLFESSFRPDSTRRYSGEHLVEESLHGRMRIVRLGATLYGMYSPGDSSRYRLITTLEATAEPTTPTGLSLAAQGQDTTEVSGLWKSLHVRAERIIQSPQ